MRDALHGGVLSGPPPPVTWQHSSWGSAAGASRFSKNTQESALATRTVGRAGYELVQWQALID